MKRAFVRAPIVFLFAALSLPACSVTMPAQAPAPTSLPLHASAGTFRDSDENTVILRGINARVLGVFDVTFDDGRLPLETIPDFTTDDAKAARKLGFNVLRLPVNWSGLEPVQGGFSATYLDRVSQIVDACRAAGIYVLLDLHQDAWSKEIGEDGSPLWAIAPPPDMLLGGPLTDLSARRTSSQVTAAFNGFFVENLNSLQSRFAEAATFLAARFGTDDDVVGFELFNEPLTTQAALDAFHASLAATLRMTTAKLLFFEPLAVRNFTDSAEISSTPFPVSDAVYAPHVYTLAFSDPQDHLTNLTYELLAPSVRSARDEATGWGTPLFIGEYGIGPTATNATEWLGFELDVQDETLASSALWLWKEESQGSWGLFDGSDGNWTPRVAYTAAVSRPYVQLAGGDLTTMKYAQGQLAYAVHRSAAVADNVYVGATSAVVTCDGTASAAMQPDTDTGVIDVACGGAGDHQITITVAAGP